jgi:hypothetical protein
MRGGTPFLIGEPVVNHNKNPFDLAVSFLHIRRESFSIKRYLRNVNQVRGFVFPATSPARGRAGGVTQTFLRSGGLDPHVEEVLRNNPAGTVVGFVEVANGTWSKGFSNHTTSAGHDHCSGAAGLGNDCVSLQKFHIARSTKDPNRDGETKQILQKNILESTVKGT